MTQSQSVSKNSRAGATTADAGEHPGRGTRNEAILQAGVAIFGSVPYDEVSVDDIAARAGVAHGLVFHYFQNKRGLYLSVLRRTAEDLQQLHTPPGAQWSPRRRVHAIINAHLDYIEAHPETLLAFLRGGVGADPEARQIIEQTRWDGSSNCSTCWSSQSQTPRSSWRCAAGRDFSTRR